VFLAHPETAACREPPPFAKNSTPITPPSATLRRRRDAIAFAVQDDRRHRNGWPFRKFDLNVVESWITLRRPIAVSVGMDRNFDKIEAGRLR
jgi:hypothetical protein